MSQNLQSRFRFALLASTRSVSNAPRDFEEVLGLDDLFPNPVTEVTVDSVKNQSVEAAKPKNLALVNYAYKTQQAEQIKAEKNYQAETAIEDKAEDAGLSTCDYMARNNRILSDSIISLAENYFKKTAQEEA